MSGEFPILQSGPTMFIDLSLLSDQWAQKVHGQSLARLAERGGLSPVEVVMNIKRIMYGDAGRIDKAKAKAYVDSISHAKRG